MKTVVAIIAVIVIVGAGAFALVKHNDNKKNTSMSGMSTSQSSEANEYNNKSSNSTSPPEASKSTDSVTISNFAFSPANITVKKGTTVTWTNKDSVTHTVVETDSKTGPKSENLDQGKSYSFTYDTAGSYAYHCSIHPNMTGTVTVTE